MRIQSLPIIVDTVVSFITSLVGEKKANFLSCLVCSNGLLSVARSFASEASSQTSAQFSLMNIANIVTLDSQITLLDFSDLSGAVDFECEDSQSFESLLFGSSFYDGRFPLRWHG